MGTDPVAGFLYVHSLVQFCFYTFAVEDEDSRQEDYAGRRTDYRRDGYASPVKENESNGYDAEYAIQ